ncbi:hypothetical protein N806_19200 [Rhodococcus sp. P27]|nr:hypothetical protein N806_19200 [Rhodococcus sp. P27]
MRPNESEWIEILASTAQAPVQTRFDSTPFVPGFEGSDHGPGGDAFTCANDCYDGS